MLNLEKYNSKKINGYTSKGNQPKWHIGNFWYKVDALGYESLSEYIVSKALIESKIKNVVSYEPIPVKYYDYNIGCKSKNFLKKNESIITLSKLYYQEKGSDINLDIKKYNIIKDKIKFIVDFIEDTTNIKNYGKELTKILEIDMFFLNEDRHFNNIAFILNDDTKKFCPSPIFDNGYSLLSDIKTYPFNLSILKLIDKVKSKPFSTDFKKQVRASEDLYGVQISLDFNKNKIATLLTNMHDFYMDYMLRRVIEIIDIQCKKYKYLLRG